MELFDKLGDTIVSVSKDATQKAKDISELARIRMELRTKQDYLNKLFLEIGKIYYDAHKDDEEKEFKEQMLLVKDAQEVIDDLKQQLGHIKGIVKCTECGNDMPIEADYCSKCGTKLVKPEKEEEVIIEEEDETAEADVEEVNTAAAEEADQDTTAAETIQKEADQDTTAAETIQKEADQDTTAAETMQKEAGQGTEAAEIVQEEQG